MPYRVFVLPIRDSRPAEAEMDGFLGSHRVLSVDRRWVDRGEDSFWAFCVDYLASPRPSSSSSPYKDGPSRDKVDYRERLSPEDFTIFARLRDLRKQVAQSEAVPVYAIFTNEQLARMVQIRAASKTALETIPGVGDGRIEKYGPKFLDLLKMQWDGADARGRPAL